MPKLSFILLMAMGSIACAPFQSFVDTDTQRYYVVQPNDNIHSIAFALELTPAQLRHANPGINPLDPEPGMRLLIPLQTVNDTYAGENSSTGTVYTASIESNQARYIWPLTKIDVSSRFGQRNGRLHSGIDLRAPSGTPIFAAADGRVNFSGYNRDYGHIVVIDHGNGIETAYAHNSRNEVGEGQTVRQGQIVGRVGRTGNATGNHVHFEFRLHGRPLNPVNHIDEDL
ncbi:MAG: peptidoglycan DD-metalloendopeptidase family protein [Gammaproteobacteria bacterium]|nr:peptidoglycan DD-metalloendopeptidase family protein [Gammaproteobacteria bacterium]